MPKLSDYPDDEPVSVPGKANNRKAIVPQELPPGDDSAFSGVEGWTRYELERLHGEDAGGRQVIVLDQANLEGKNTGALAMGGVSNSRSRVKGTVPQPAVHFQAVIIE